MVSLSQIQSGRIKRPARLLVYGTEGIGKSSLAAQAPSPIFLPTESGLDQIDCHSFPLATQFDHVEQALGALIREEHDYRTVVIDSLDWLEMLIFEAVTTRYKANNIEQVAGGFGRGYKIALGYWQRIVDRLKTLRASQMAVILIAHAKIEKFEDPEVGATYDRYCPRLNKHAGALIKEWVDAILFATREISVKTQDTGFGRERTVASGGDKRVLKCVGTPSCVAKNRYDMPATIPLSWKSLVQALSGNGDTGRAKTSVVDERQLVEA